MADDPKSFLADLEKQTPSTPARSEGEDIAAGSAPAVSRAIQVARKQRPSLLSLDLARLSVAGWAVTVVTIAIAAGVAWLVAYNLSSAGFRGKFVAGVCVPIALTVAGVLLWTASWLASVMGYPLVREVDPSASQGKP